MTIYIAIWFVLLFASARRGNMWFVWVMMFLLTVLSGLRADSVGTDTEAYRAIFTYVASHGWSSYPEPGWVALNKIVAWAGGDFGSLLWVIAAVTLIPVGIVISRESENKSFALFTYYSLFIFFSIWNTARQTMAMSFVLIGYLALSKGRPWRFVLWALFGALFHLSAVFSLLVLAIRKIRITWPRLVVAMPITFFMGLFMTSNLIAMVAGPYAFYLSGDAAKNESPAMMIALSLAYNALLLWVFYSSTPRLRESLWMKIFTLGVVLYNLMMNFELGTRMILYFTMAQIILFPYYIYNNTVKQKGLAILIICIYLSTMFYLLIGTNSRNIIPYIPA